MMYTTQPDMVYIDDKIGRLFVFKMAYTGSTDFSLGIEYSRIKIPLNFSEEILKVVNLAFVAKYFF